MLGLRLGFAPGAPPAYFLQQEQKADDGPRSQQQSHHPEWMGLHPIGHARSQRRKTSGRRGRWCFLIAIFCRRFFCLGFMGLLGHCGCRFLRVRLVAGLRGVRLSMLTVASTWVRIDRFRALSVCWMNRLGGFGRRCGLHRLNFFQTLHTAFQHFIQTTQVLTTLVEELQPVFLVFLDVLGMLRVLGNVGHRLVDFLGHAVQLGLTTHGRFNPAAGLFTVKGQGLRHPGAAQPQGGRQEPTGPCRANDAK